MLARTAAPPLLLASLAALAAAGCGGSSGSSGGSGGGGTAGLGAYCKASSDCRVPYWCEYPTGATSGSCTAATCEVLHQASVYAGNTLDLGIHTVGDTVHFDVPPGTAGFSILAQVEPISAGSNVLTAPISIVPSGSNAIENGVVPNLVTTPSGSTYYDDFASPPNDAYGYPDWSKPQAAYLIPRGFAAAFTVPNTSAALSGVAAGNVAAGSWSFLVNDYAYECATGSGCSVPAGSGTAGAYDLQVLLRPAAATGGIPSTGTLDVTIYFVSSSYTAAAAGTDPRFQRFVQDLQALYAPAGITVRVTWADAPLAAIDRFSTIVFDPSNPSPCGDERQLYTYGDTTDDGARLFLVDAITEASPTQNLQVLGFDGAVPGPSALPATVSSGSVASLGASLPSLSPTDPYNYANTCGQSPSFSLTTCGVDVLAYVAAHEIGHWLGLYHTTEETGDQFDTLDDTPICGCTQCTAAGSADQKSCNSNGPKGAPTLMKASWCTGSASSPCPGGGDLCSAASPCGGGADLMFYMLDQTVSTGELSPQQAAVMRANPAVR